MKQKNWWIDEELLERLNEYRFENRIESETEAVRRLLDEALTRWEKEQSKS